METGDNGMHGDRRSAVLLTVPKGIRKRDIYAHCESMLYLPVFATINRLIAKDGQ